MFFCFDYGTQLAPGALRHSNIRPRALFRRDSAHDPSTVLRGGNLDFPYFEQLLDDTLHDAPTFLDVCDFTPPKDNGYLDFVFMCQELFGLLDLEFDVVNTGLWAQPDFLGLSMMRVTTGGLLVPLVFVFAVVHDTAHGRSCIWSYFYQIQPSAAGTFKS